MQTQQNILGAGHVAQLTNTSVWEEFSQILLFHLPYKNDKTRIPHLSSPVCNATEIMHLIFVCGAGKK